MTDLEKIEDIIKHKNGIIADMHLLARKCMKSGDVQLGVKLFANSYIHDFSKFNGIELAHLYKDNPDKDSLALAWMNHSSTNPHHPEYWVGGIHAMPREYIGEMLCDWKQRANEFGSSLKDWINGEGAKRYGYTARDKVYDEIMYFFGLLCDQPFTQLRPEGQ